VSVDPKKNRRKMRVRFSEAIGAETRLYSADGAFAPSLQEKSEKEKKGFEAQSRAPRGVSVDPKKNRKRMRVRFLKPSAQKTNPHQTPKLHRLGKSVRECIVDDPFDLRLRNLQGRVHFLTERVLHSAELLLLSARTFHLFVEHVHLLI